MNLPLEFITFGITQAKMYKHFRNSGSFIAPFNTRKRWGNTVVYGGLFYCPDIDFYLRILDAYHMCSLSTLGKNHIKDIHHRIITDIIPIYFDTLDNLSRLKYTEKSPVSAHIYFGNAKYPRLAKRILRPNRSYRMIDGIEAGHFKNLYEEVENCTKKQCLDT